MIEKTYPLIEKHILSFLQLTEQLYQQLNKEADNLRNAPQVETIGCIANDKTLLVEQMEKLSKQLGDLLSLERLPYDQEGIRSCFQLAETSGFSTLEATRNWAQINKISAECRVLNDRNGACIDLLSHHVKRSLHILKGKPQLASTYGADGVTKSDYFGHTLTFV